MATTNVTETLLAVDMLRARVAELEAQTAFAFNTNDALHWMWIVRCFVLVFLMQLGFATLHVAYIRTETPITTYVRNAINFFLAVHVAYFWGYNLADPLIPAATTLNPNERFLPACPQLIRFLGFQATSACIVSSAMAERTSLVGYFLLSILVSGLIYPLGERWTTQGGWLSDMDPPFHDFAGSASVHVLGGVIGLVGCASVGSRSGLEDANVLDALQVRSVPSAMLGTAFVLVGWCGLNLATLAMTSIEDASMSLNILVTTTLAVSATAMSSFFFCRFASIPPRNVNVLDVSSCLLGGMSAITAGCDVISPLHSIIVGAIAYWVCRGSSELKRLFKIDDVVDGFAVHGACGAWGMLAVGLFHKEAGAVLGYGPALLWNQLTGAVALIGMAALISGVFLFLLRLAGLLCGPALGDMMGPCACTRSFTHANQRKVRLLPGKAFLEL